ncbi:MAG: FmdE family protein [Armatimonadota bacterium]|nr:FmdE family protein [Armatimonadota bacterium]MDR5702419.1 FmdE family protein [Armatimonadota bacterium]MDR7435704.1 FmdE family protein [Armatimonadota bacterium]
MTLEELLNAAAANHHRLCPRQVLGVRMGLAGGRWLGLEVPRRDKRLLALIETDGCFADAISVATGCHIGRRTMRLIDHGKVAATFVDTQVGKAVRVVPRPGVRERAWVYAPEAKSRWQAQLLGYQRMPEEELLAAEEVTLLFSLEKLISRKGVRVHCQACSEEILNEREVVRDGMTLCRSCAGERYYAPAGKPLEGIPQILGPTASLPPLPLL